MANIRRKPERHAMGLLLRCYAQRGNLLLRRAPQTHRLCWCGTCWPQSERGHLQPPHAINLVPATGIQHHKNLLKLSSHIASAVSSYFPPITYARCFGRVESAVPRQSLGTELNFQLHMC